MEFATRKKTWKIFGKNQQKNFIPKSILDHLGLIGTNLFFSITTAKKLKKFKSLLNCKKTATAHPVWVLRDEVGLRK